MQFTIFTTVAIHWHNTDFYSPASLHACITTHIPDSYVLMVTTHSIMVVSKSELLGGLCMQPNCN